MSKKRYRCEVLMGRDIEVFKRFGNDEDTVRSELQEFLKEAYGHIFQIQSVYLDKTNTVKAYCQ